jgi:hypothetical protein
MTRWPAGAGIHRLSVSPATEDPSARDWARDANGSPVTSEVKFRRGEAVVRDDPGRFFVDRGYARKTRPLVGSLRLRCIGTVRMPRCVSSERDHEIGHEGIRHLNPIPPTALAAPAATRASGEIEHARFERQPLPLDEIGDEQVGLVAAAARDVDALAGLKVGQSGVVKSFAQVHQEF